MHAFLRLSNLRLETLDQLSAEKEINSPARAKLSTNTLNPIKWIKKKQADVRFRNQIYKLFKDYYHIDNHSSFIRIWKHILSHEAVYFSKKGALTVGQLRDIKKAFDRCLTYTGPGLGSRSRKDTEKLTRKMTEFLLLGSDLNGKGADLKWKDIKAILIRKDPKMLESFRSELKSLLEELVHVPRDTDSNKLLFDIHLGNIISILPFTYPTGGTIRIPQEIDKKMELVEYKIEPIPLTASSLASPFFAYGLVPNNKKAKPILAYSGTTYPAGDGFAVSLLSDFTPGHSVGKLAYSAGKKKIENWLKDKKDVYVCGKSLGGALAFHTLQDFKEKISRVDAYNPPGLYPWEWKKEYNDENIEINIFTQPRDIVSELGAWPEGNSVSHYEIIPDTGSKKSPNWMKAHAQSFSGYDKIFIVKSSTDKINQKKSRLCLTGVHIFAGPFLVFGPVATGLVIKKIFKEFAVGANHLLKKLYSFAAS